VLLSVPGEENGKNDAMRTKLRHMHQEQVRLAREAAMMAKRAALSARAKEQRGLSPSIEPYEHRSPSIGAIDSLGPRIVPSDPSDCKPDEAGWRSPANGERHGEGSDAVADVAAKDGAGGMLLVPAARRDGWRLAALPRAAELSVNLTLFGRPLDGMGRLEGMGRLDAGVEALMAVQGVERCLADARCCREIVVYSPLPLTVAVRARACVCGVRVCAFMCVCACGRVCSGACGATRNLGELRVGGPDVRRDLNAAPGASNLGPSVSDLGPSDSDAAARRDSAGGAGAGGAAHGAGGGGRGGGRDGVRRI
jgi:hypothetical protein